MLQDLKYALRSLGKSPGLVTVLVATLALAIGASTAIFSVVDALLFRPLPYPNAYRLYAVTFRNDQLLGSQYWSYPKYGAFAKEQTAFSSTAAYARRVLTVETEGQPRRADVEVVTPSYFSLLGLTPAAGRLFETLVREDLMVSEGGRYLSVALPSLRQRDRGPFTSDPFEHAVGAVGPAEPVTSGRRTESV
jgi:hypothetical protein